MTDTIDQFVDQQTSPNTRRAYRTDLTRWVAFLDGRHPTMDDVIQFKQGLEAALAPASARRVFAAVRSYYRWVGGENPFDRVKAPQSISNQTPKTPSDAAVNRLLDAVDTSDLNGLRHKAILTLLANGLRAQEVADLGEDDLFFEQEYGAFILRVTGKGRKERLVPATPEAVAAVHAFRVQDQRRPATLLFDYDLSPLTYEQVRFAVDRWATAAGLEGMHPHALRHHYATRLTRAGVNVLHLQKLLGHARADTTQQYVGLDLGDLVEAAQRDPRAQTEERPALTVVA